MKLEQEIKHRSSHQRCSVKIGVLKNFAKFIGKHLYKSLFFNKVSRPGSEVVVQRCSVKKGVLGNFTFSQENTCPRVSILISRASNFIKKETLAQVFSCEFCEISKNTFFHRAPPVAASVGSPGLRMTASIYMIEK